MFGKGKKTFGKWMSLLSFLVKEEMKIYFSEACQNQTLSKLEIVMTI